MDTREKRSTVLKHLHRVGTGVGFVQETQFRTDRKVIMRNRDFQSSFYTKSVVAKARGVCILFSSGIFHGNKRLPSLIRRAGISLSGAW